MRFRLALTLSLWSAALAADPGPAHLKSRLPLALEVAGFGGLSGLIMAPDGTRATMLSDDAQLFELELARDDQGQLVGASLANRRTLFASAALEDPDTEGLARGPDGAVFVSLEDPPLILTYAADASLPQLPGLFAPVDTAHFNRGMEALAIDGRGRLIALPEIVMAHRADFPVLRYEDGRWSVVRTLSATRGFLVVGADVGPDGQLYVLERAASLLGFRSRVRRLSLTDPDAPVETLLLSDVAQFDNLEGISVWRGPGDALHISLISDNNFLAPQRSELIEFVLHD